MFTSLGRQRLMVGLLAIAIIIPAVARAASLEETKDQRDQRMAWWREAKFGMFIHWGLYSLSAGDWKGTKVPNLSCLLQQTANVSPEEYAQLQKQFNPVNYDAKEWVALAKLAGAKYIVITSKHHEGFCLFDSKLTDFDAMGTPYGRDLLKPLADECHRQGIKICFYHSILDWHHPDAKGERFPQYVDHMRGQLRELLSGYGPIGVLWFDGEWIPEWTEEQGQALYRDLRKIQPDLIINDRVGRGRQITRAEKRKNVDDTREFAGDFGTPEQEIPGTGMPGWDWETCMTMNDNWGFKQGDDHWKSTEDILHKLVDIASKGGNFLLNVGPTAAGEIPPPSIERLEAIGRWLAVNGESIYGTAASPFAKLDWGRCTRKPGVLYLHVFDWPKDARLVVPGLANKTGKAYLLADKDRKPLAVARAEKDVVITLPTAAPDPIDTVVVLEIEGEPRVSP